MAVSTGVAVRVLVGVSVGSGDGVGEGVLVGVGVLVAVGVNVTVAVGVRVKVAVGSAVSVADCVAVDVAVAGISAICPVQPASKLIAATQKSNLKIICYSTASLDSPPSPVSLDESGQPTFQMRERRSLSGLRAPV